MSLSKQQMLDALDGLIADCATIHGQFLGDYDTWTPSFAAWLKACEATIEVIFGSLSDALLSFRGIYFIPPPDQQYPNDEETRKAQLLWFDSGLRYAHSTLVGFRYSVDKLAPDDSPRPTPFIFVSHGGPTRTHVDATRDFLAALGLSPVIVADMPNLNFSVNEKVRFYLGICSGAVVLATEEDETLARETRARPNVENEIGMLQLAPAISNRIVYMKEPNVQFASNYREKVWLSFHRSRVQDSFTPLVKELRAFGLLG